MVFMMLPFCVISMKRWTGHGDDRNRRPVAGAAGKVPDKRWRSAATHMAAVTELRRSLRQSIVRAADAAPVTAVVVW